MVGRVKQQRDLFDSDNVYLGFVGPDSFYGFLASVRDELFRDEDFAVMYSANNGRPSVPPSRLAVATVLQYYDRLSDQAATDHAAFDLRWMVALGSQPTERPFAKSTLQLFRAQLLVHPQIRLVFEKSLELARKRGYVRQSKTAKIALDTSNILGRGAVEDSYNLISEGIRQSLRGLARVLGRKPEEYAGELGLKRHLGSSIKGETEVDWQDRASVAGFLGGLVSEARKVLATAAEVLADLEAESADSRKLKAACQLLEQILLQDVGVRPKGSSGTGPAKKAEAASNARPARAAESEPGPRAEAEPELAVLAAPATGSEIKTMPTSPAGEAPEPVSEVATPTSVLSGPIRQDEEYYLPHNPSGDRVCSFSDPEMRHGRKSASKRFDGHKVAVAVDVESQLFTAVDVLAGSAPDDQGSLELTQESAGSLEKAVAEVLADCAYGNGENRQRFADAGLTLHAKVAAEGDRGVFPKSAFVIDLAEMTITCPAGEVSSKLVSAGSTLTKDGVRVQQQAFAFDKALCAACPLLANCMTAEGKPRGRRVQLHPQEDLLQAARHWKLTEAYQQFRKDRQVVEHRIARLMQLGLRQARYLGLHKTRFQILMTAAVANLTLISGWAKSSPEAPEKASQTPSRLATAAFRVAGGLWAASRQYLRSVTARWTRPIKPALLLASPVRLAS